MVKHVGKQAKRDAKAGKKLKAALRQKAKAKTPSLIDAANDAIANAAITGYNIVTGRWDLTAQPSSWSTISSTTARWR